MTGESADKLVAEAPFVLAVIGGGVNGCGIARDAAGRGARVLLLERGDLASGTSSASTKLIHCGLRYLEQFEFGLVREALRERETLWKIAPHIIHPLRFVLPHRKGLRPRWLLRDFSGGLSAAEVDYCMDREWARNADDMLWRRSKLGLRSVPGGPKALDLYMARRRA